MVAEGDHDRPTVPRPGLQSSSGGQPRRRPPSMLTVGLRGHDYACVLLLSPVYLVSIHFSVHTCKVCVCVHVCACVREYVAGHFRVIRRSSLDVIEGVIEAPPALAVE
eukprot:GHVU01221653.1.p1 GENE.GHVU01221653.1~~GHVU01221653.1.p1  ORF type:complete len:108 (-),score=3.18 GHVU01221653.1:71-394(-)